MNLGVHVSTAGGICAAVKRARELKCTTMQIFIRSPQRTRETYLSKDEIAEFVRERKKARLDPVFVHMNYVVNLASPFRKIIRRSIKDYIEDIKECYALKAEYLVTHMGSHRDTSEAAGFRRLIKALNTIISETKDFPVGILLENVCGAGSWLGYSFLHHKKVIEKLQDPDRVGICLDTAHAYSAGYNIATKDGLDATLDEIDRLLGIKKLKMIHLNDSKDTFDSRRDRHEHIGKGKIGLQGIQRIVNHPKLKNVPLILETPKDFETADLSNLKTVRALVKK